MIKSKWTETLESNQYKYKHLFTAVQKEGYEHLDIIEAL